MFLENLEEIFLHEFAQNMETEKEISQKFEPC